jgi:hypothetical protein
MFSILIQEFDSSLPIDNGMLIADIKNGVPITERDIIDVVINSRALFVLSTLACRELPRVEDCFKLWTETAELITGLCASWAQVAADDYPQVGWLLTELRRLQTLCIDRVELYTISEQQRLEHAKTRDADFEDTYCTRNGLELRGEHSGQSSPAHIYSVGHF